MFCEIAEFHSLHYPAISYTIAVAGGVWNRMADPQLDRTAGFIVPRNQPLIGIISYDDGQENVHYFSEEKEAEAAISSNAIQEILNMAGSWGDLNWDIVEEELYRIRHESSPTPPISL
jgi:hypothetical protein